MAVGDESWNRGPETEWERIQRQMQSFGNENYTSEGGFGNGDGYGAGVFRPTQMYQQEFQNAKATPQAIDAMNGTIEGVNGFGLLENIRNQQLGMNSESPPGEYGSVALPGLGGGFVVNSTGGISGNVPGLSPEGYNTQLYVDQNTGKISYNHYQQQSTLDGLKQFAKEFVLPAVGMAVGIPMLNEAMGFTAAAGAAGGGSAAAGGGIADIIGGAVAEAGANGGAYLLPGYEASTAAAMAGGGGAGGLEAWAASQGAEAAGGGIADAISGAVSEAGGMPSYGAPDVFTPSGAEAATGGLESWANDWGQVASSAADATAPSTSPVDGTDQLSNEWDKLTRQAGNPQGGNPIAASPEQSMLQKLGSMLDDPKKAKAMIDMLKTVGNLTGGGAGAGGSGSGGGGGGYDPNFKPREAAPYDPHRMIMRPTQQTYDPFWAMKKNGAPTFFEQPRYYREKDGRPAGYAQGGPVERTPMGVDEKKVSSIRQNYRSKKHVLEDLANPNSRASKLGLRGANDPNIDHAFAYTAKQGKHDKPANPFAKFDGKKKFAEGGAVGGGIASLGDGMSDSVPAMIDGKQPAALSSGEYVIPADTVSHLGNGDSAAGTRVLDEMQARIRQARTGNPEQAPQINPAKFMPK